MSDASASQQYFQGTVVSLDVHRDRKNPNWKKSAVLRIQYRRTLAAKLKVELCKARRPVFQRRDNKVIFSNEEVDLSVVLRIGMSVYCRIEKGRVVAFTLLKTWQECQLMRDLPMAVNAIVREILEEDPSCTHYVIVGLVQSRLRQELYIADCPPSLIHPVIYEIRPPD